jgi:hypothetical protein
MSNDALVLQQKIQKLKKEILYPASHFFAKELARATLLSNLLSIVTQQCIRYGNTSKKRRFSVT